VVLSGNLSPASPVADLLRERLNREIQPLLPGLAYPADFPVAEYAANLGLAVAHRFRELSQGNLPAQRGMAVNLLPQRYSPKSLPLKPLALGMALVLLGLLAFGVLTPQVAAAQAESDQLASRLTNLERAERLQVLAQNRVSRFEEELALLRSQANNLDDHQLALRTEIQTLIDRLVTLSDTALPRGVEVSDLTRNAQGFAVSGTAFDYEDVIQYKTNLQNSGHFRRANILAVQARGSGVAFQLNALVATAPAAAGTEPPAK
jgi:Tfp pilus assembly protein PilN